MKRYVEVEVEENDLIKIPARTGYQYIATPLEPLTLSDIITAEIPAIRIKLNKMVDEYNDGHWSKLYLVDAILNLLKGGE